MWRRSHRPRGSRRRARVAADARARRAGARRHAARRDVEQRAAREHHRALDHVRELAHVAGPVVGEQALAWPRARCASMRLPSSRAKRSAKKCASSAMSPLALAQRRHHDREDVQAEEEIGAEAPGGDLLLEVAVGRRDHAHVDLARLRCCRPARSRAPGARAAASPACRAAARRSRRGRSCRRRRPRSARCAPSSAPVKAPRTWPNSSLSTSPAEIAEQFTFTSGRSRRGLRSWIARAISSLPVPVSPRISTVDGVGATVSTSESTFASAGLRADDLARSCGPAGSPPAGRRSRRRAGRAAAAAPRRRSSCRPRRRRRSPRARSARPGSRGRRRAAVDMKKSAPKLFSSRSSGSAQSDSMPSRSITTWVIGKRSRSSSRESAT